LNWHIKPQSEIAEAPQNYEPVKIAPVDLLMFFTHPEGSFSSITYLIRLSDKIKRKVRGFKE
jgi:hypothetical protein